MRCTRPGTGWSPSYTQPDRPAGRGQSLASSPVKQRALQLGIAVEQPAIAQVGRRRRAPARARARPDGGGGLRADPAAGGARRAAPRLLEHPRLAAAALARRGADPAGDPRRRRGHRHHHHADGRRARHRTDAAHPRARRSGRASTAGRCTTGCRGLGAEAIVAAIAGWQAGRVAAAAAAGATERDLRRQDPQGRGAHRLVAAGRRHRPAGAGVQSLAGRRNHLGRQAAARVAGRARSSGVARRRESRHRDRVGRGPPGRGDRRGCAAPDAGAAAPASAPCRRPSS